MLDFTKGHDDIIYIHVYNFYIYIYICMHVCMYACNVM